MIVIIDSPNEFHTKLDSAEIRKRLESGEEITFQAGTNFWREFVGPNRKLSVTAGLTRVKVEAITGYSAERSTGP